MKTIRRLYFYAIAYISMEVVLWGLIGLARSLFSNAVGGAADLAQALALILVGVPVFGIHWRVSQRNAQSDAEERASGVRAFFLYLTLFTLFIPIVQSVWAVLNRLLFSLFDLNSANALLGGRQSLSDNLIAILMNSALAAYFWQVLGSDWKSVSEQSALRQTRRIYRYLWLFYGLTLSVSGTQQILRYLFSELSLRNEITTPETVINGLVLLLVGAPLWGWTWQNIQKGLDEVGERSSLLRLGVLYFLSLAGVITVLTCAGIVVNEILNLLFSSANHALTSLLRNIRNPLSIGIPLGVVWAYYGGWLKRDLAAVPDAPRRASLTRIYTYILAWIGLVATFSGVSVLLSFLLDMLSGESFNSLSISGRLSDALAILIVGLPLWLLNWRPMQAEAIVEGEAGEHARRSLTRKIYLYVAIFAGVVGGMVAAVWLVSLLIEALLNSRVDNFADSLRNSLEMLFVFGALLIYHWKTLQLDGTRQSALLDAKRAAFNVLFLANSDDPLALQLASAMAKDGQEINLIVQPAPETDTPIHALILPEDAAFTNDAKLGTWIRTFDGIKFIIPHETSQWLWLRDPAEIAKSLQRLAEGESILPVKKAPGWMIAVYILAGLMAFEILFGIFGIIVSSLGL